MSRIRLRPATRNDRGLLEYWDTKPHVIDASGSDGWYDWVSELGKTTDYREILIAELDGRPIGCMEIIDPAREETHYWGDVEPNLRAIDVWIGEEADLGRGYGTEMMRQAIARCFAEPDVTAILIDPLESNVAARRFYERLGFREIERRVFDTDRCVVYRLER